MRASVAQEFESGRGLRCLLRGFYLVLRPSLRRRLLRKRVARDGCEAKNAPDECNKTKCHATSSW